MAGQSTVNFFDINNKRKNQNQGATNILSGSSTTGTLSNTETYVNKYTKDMEKLDKELEAEGLKIERLSDQEKQNYVNSLTDTEYQRMTQYRDAGYSFGSAKALLELEKQRDNPTNVGGYRGQGFQLAEPVGGQESTWNKINIIGYLTEKLDDRVQNDIVPALTVDQREKRSQELYDKYSKMTQADWDKLYQQFKNDPKARTFEDDSLDYTLKRYWEDQNKSFWDKLRGAGLNISEDENGVKVEPDNTASPLQMITNAPTSALANASAVLRGVTNPLDNLSMLINLLGTKEGRDILSYRYLDEEGRQESAEKDPIGWVLDLFDFGSLGLNLSAKTSRLGAGGSRLVGAKNTANRLNKTANTLEKTANTMENIADMGISEQYNNLLNKQLNKLSAGNKGANLLGDYISLTQRPLATIRGGANPKNEKGQQVVANGSWTIGGIQNGVNKVLQGVKNKIQENATGLTPEVRERIRQNPYIRDYRERIEAMLQDEGAPMDNQKIMEGPIEEVGNELLRRLNEYEARLEENGAEYQVLRNTTKPYDFSNFMNGVYEVFSENGITITPEGELTFSTTANPADMNPVNTARYVIRDMVPNLSNMTIPQFLDFRKKLRSLINYESDSRSTRYSKKIIRQLVDGVLNKLAHKMIPTLAKVDEIYHKQINELKEFKDGLVYQQGEKRGQIKDNFYSIISTLNTQNRQKMKERVERIFPDLGARVEAIRMLPKLAKAYQNSPQMMRALFQKAGFLGGIAQSGGVKKAVVGWLLGIVADELFAKPLGEKRRKKAIDELMQEVSPEAIQKLAEIKSKIDAGVELSEQEKKDLATAMQEIALREYEYLDEQHKKEFDKILQSANNQQPKLPAPGMDVIYPNGTIKLGTGNPLNSPSESKPKPRNRAERVKQVQEENNVDQETAEEMVDRYEDFMDEVGGDINGNLDTREVNYERFSTKTLEGLMKDDIIPQSEKAKIENVLVKRGSQDETSDWQQLDQEFAYRIMKLDEEEQRVGKVGKNKVSREVAKKQQDAVDNKRDKLVEEMRERYAGQGTALDQQRGEDKYTELAGKGVDYANQYKKSKKFKEDEAERQILNQLKQEWGKTPKFIREMNDNTASKRNEFIDNVDPTNGYTMETTDYNDRYVNKQTGDKGAIKYNEDGTIEVVANNLEGLKQSGILDALPDDAIVKVSGETEQATVGELKDYEYQTVGRANSDERTITAEEGLQTRSYKRDKTIGELADEYGLEKKIVDKIFTNAGEEALGRAKGNLVELAKRIKEGTAPHEVFHPIFNMVNAKRRAEIIDLVRREKGFTEKEAKEWLADSFSEYFRTGDFDSKPIPKGFVNKVKWFFNKVKEFINGMWSNKKKIRKLFDDIMEGKIDMEELKPNGDYEYQIQQKSLFNQEPEVSEEKMRKEFLKENDKLVKLLERYTQHTAVKPDKLPQILNDTYTPDLNEWKKRIDGKNLKRLGFEEEELIDLYYAFKDIADNPKAMQHVRTNKDKGAMPTYYELITKMKANPLKIPDELANEKRLAPLRRALYDLNGTGVEDLIDDYNPDIVERANNLRSRISSKVTMKELYNIKNLLDDYINNANLDIPIKGTFANEDINRLIDTVRTSEKYKADISTYDQKQILKVARETEDILERRLEQIKLYYDQGLAESQDIQDIRADERQDFEPQFLYGLAKAYVPNVDKWHRNLKKRFSENLKDFEGFKGVTQYKHFVEPHQLNSLKSKIKELEGYSYDQISQVYEGTWVDVFFRYLEPRIEELQAKGTDKAVTDLIALSDMSVENFERQMKGFGGKSPMPSIAVQDPNVPSGSFGELTVLFGRETVDPEIDERNKLYGSDAWTPVFPSVKEVSADGLDELKSLLYSERPTINYEKKFGFNGHKKYLDKMQSLINRIKQSDSNSIGTLIRNKMLEKRLRDLLYPQESIDAIKKFMSSNADKLTNKLVIPASYFDETPRYRNADQIAEELVDYVPDEVKENYDEGTSGLNRLQNDILKVLNKNTNLKDRIANLLDALEMSFGIEYSPEVEEIVRRLELEEPGDRPLTPENVLEAMKRQKVNRETTPGSFRDMIEIEGTKVNTIEDVRKRNFAKVYHGDRVGELGDLEERYNNLLDIVQEIGFDNDIIHNTLAENFIEKYNTQELIDKYNGDINKEKRDLTELLKTVNRNDKLSLLDKLADFGLRTPKDEPIGGILEIIDTVDKEVMPIRTITKESYNMDVKEFKANMKSHGYDVPEEVLQRLIDVVEQGRKIPIRFSESKPERVVDLTKEVKYVLVPEKDKARVDKIVEGTPLEGKVVGYKEDNNIPHRTEKIKELQKKYGNIFFSMGGVVMPIAMLYMMIQGGDDDQQESMAV